MYKNYYYFIFLLIFLQFPTINTKNKCIKCPKNGKKFQLLRRQKRGICCSTPLVNEEIETHRQRPGKEHVKNEDENLKKILYITDNYYKSHCDLNVLLVKILAERYLVQFVIYTKPEGENIEKMLEEINANLSNIKLIKVDISEESLNSTNEENHNDRYYNFRLSLEFLFIGIYREIIIQKINREFLLEQNYDLGIAEFTQQIGAFQVFNALKIQKTIDISPSRIPDDHLERIDSGFNRSQISALNNFPIEHLWTEDYELNNKYKELVKTFPNINWAMPINIFDIFQNINFHFSNHHFLAKVFPEHPKVGYIGGILVEEKKILIKDKIPTDDNYSCLGLFSMGTLVPLQEKNIVGIKVMFKTMASLSYLCKFTVRINRNLIPAEYSKNIEVFDEFIPQQELLAKQNMRIFISHCGINSINEAMYAGVPLICLPYGYDQPYNSAIVEYLGIGITVERENLANEISNAMNEILFNSKYLNNAFKLRQKILNQFNTSSQKDKFLQIIGNIIG